MYNQYDPYAYYYQPYYPYKPSFIQSMRYSMHQINLQSTIKAASKTLYTANQIIPLINQLRPVIHNATTAFRVAKAVKSMNTDTDEEIDNSLNNQIFENMI